MKGRYIMNIGQIEEIDLTPFYAETLATSIQIRTDIDKIYEKDKYTYYKYSKNSEYYSCVLAQGLSLAQEIYFKKSLGIVEYIKETKQYTILFKLFKKAYKKTYNFFKDKKRVDFNEFFDYLNSFKGFVDKISENEINGLFVSALFFSSEADVVLNEDLITTTLANRWHHYSGNNRLSYSSINDATPKERTKIQKIFKKIDLKKIKEEKLLGLIPDKVSGLSYLYDAEYLDIFSISEGIEIGTNEVKTVILAYHIAEAKGEVMDFYSYLVASLHIILLCRAYKKAKSEYFQYDNETQSLNYAEKEVQKIKKENELLNKEIQKLKTENELLKEQLNEKQEQLKKQKQLIKEQENQKNDELNSLREYIFSQNNNTSSQIEQTEIGTEQIAKINKLKGIIIGGNINWQKKIKQELTDWHFKIPNINLEENILKEVELVVFNTSCLNHSMYRKAIKICRMYGIPVKYINATNVNKTLEQLLTIIK